MTFSDTTNNSAKIEKYFLNLMFFFFIVCDYICLFIGLNNCIGFAYESKAVKRISEVCSYKDFNFILY